MQNDISKFEITERAVLINNSSLRPGTFWVSESAGVAIQGYRRRVPLSSQERAGVR